MSNTSHDAVFLTLLSQWEFGVLWLAAATIISGVVLNHVIWRLDPSPAVVEERILIATVTMTLFFVALFAVARFEVGRLSLSYEVELVSKLAGCLIVSLAAVINIAGRIALGNFWSDQIVITENHRLVRSWPYSWSRHPLYGSLLMFGLGMGLLAINPVVVSATLLLFAPAMRHRSRREEKVLVDAFGEDYRQFQREVPMLLPGLPESAARVARGLLAGMQLWAALFQLLDVLLLSALLTLGLSFMMQRDDFRLAYKFKPGVIVLCVALAYLSPSLAFLLWVPAFASLMSVTGQCPGTLLLRTIRARKHGSTA